MISEEHHLEVYGGERWLERLYLDHLVEDCVVAKVAGVLQERRHRWIALEDTTSTLS